MSSAISSIQYNRKTKTLVVGFVKGGSHTYYDVPRSVASQFKNAESQGKYFNFYIKHFF